LDNSNRSLLKATYTPIALPAARLAGTATATAPARALEKAQFVNSLQLDHGEVRAALRYLPPDVPPDRLLALEAFEQRPGRVSTPDPATLAGLDVASLQAFGSAIRSLRQAALPSGDGAHDPPNSEATPGPAGAPRLAGGVAQAEVLPAGEGVLPLAAVSSPVSDSALSTQPLARADLLPAAATGDLARAYARLMITENALATFVNAVQISPIGMLHLERIEMAPAGIERGELVGTIALAPKEQTNVVQKEWSVTSEEFSSIVTDSLENYSEKGVTEKSELADATSNQTKHTSQISLGASVSGSYGTVSFSTNASLGINDSAEQSAQASRKQTSDMTSKASARVRKERKVTIETQATVGSEDVTTRTLVNPSDSQSMRIDYFSMMRKWRVRLLQYGLRMTYDIGVPEPAATLREAHAQLAALDAQVSTPFAFGLQVTDITTDNYPNLAASYGASVPEPPQQLINQRFGGVVQGLGKLGDDESWHFYELQIAVPDGYQVSGVWLDAMIGNVNNDPVARNFVVFGYGQPPGLGTNGKGSFTEDLSGAAGFLINRTGEQKVVYFLQNVDAAAVTIVCNFSPLPQTMDQWRFAVWQALHDAAQNAYYTGIQALTMRRDALRARIQAPDTLTLRQEERIEVMKAALRWLLGPDFDFMPPSIVALFASSGGTGGLSFTGSELGLNSTGWMAMFRYQEMVKFLQQAIEWENLLYFLYPYFWDVPPAWDFVRTLEHPDSDRQQFLRAGSARIVLTIRPGYEEAFTAFVDQGAFGAVLPPNHPYLTIGQELQAYDQTNYPGIPPANPATGYRPLLSTLQRAAWQSMQAIIAALEQYKTDKGSYPATGQGLAALADPSLAKTDPWGKAWVYACPGVYSDYELSSLGADGKPGGDGLNAEITSWASASLVGEWFEYTPSKGIDIQVNTAVETMS
jgi:hypothetical protein